MKYFLLFFSFTLFLSCDFDKPKTKKPSFLIGNWIQVNRLDSLKTYETWTKDFSGIGLTLKGIDTTFFEKMKIVEKNDTLFLKVSGVNDTPTFFKFTSLTDSSFVCENPKNDFPKKIKYFTEYNYLKAEISNNTASVHFVFEKLEDIK